VDTLPFGYTSFGDRTRGFSSQYSTQAGLLQCLRWQGTSAGWGARRSLSWVLEDPGVASRPALPRGRLPSQVDVPARGRVARDTSPRSTQYLPTRGTLHPPRPVPTPLPTWVRTPLLQLPLLPSGMAPHAQQARVQGSPGSLAHSPQTCEVKPGLSAGVSVVGRVGKQASNRFR